MGCGSGRPYTEKDIEMYVKKNQVRLLSAELIDGTTIRLKSDDGFFNASSLLDSTWLKGQMTNHEYCQAIEHINQRVAQCLIGASNNMSIGQVPKAQSTKLAIQELNAKYADRVTFAYEANDDPNSTDASNSFVDIKMK